MDQGSIHIENYGFDIHFLPWFGKFASNKKQWIIFNPMLDFRIYIVSFMYCSIIIL